MVTNTDVTNVEIHIQWRNNMPISINVVPDDEPGIILYTHPANERRRYNVTSSLIGWAHTQNDPCKLVKLGDWALIQYKDVISLV